MTLVPSSTRLNQLWMLSCRIGASRMEFSGMPATLRTTYPMCQLCLKRHCINAPSSQTHWIGSLICLPPKCCQNSQNIFLSTSQNDYLSFVKGKTSLSIFINLWEKTFSWSYLEFLDEFSIQLMLCQLRTISISETGLTGELDESLLRLLSECNIQMNCSQWMHLMEVMTCIK